MIICNNDNKKINNNVLVTIAEVLAAIISNIKKFGLSKIVFVAIALVIIFGISFVKMASRLGDGSGIDNKIALSLFPKAETSLKMDYISIPQGTIDLNPFLPYRNIDDNGGTVIDVPTFDLVAPPEAVSEGSDAARVMDTIVSGILYDKFSPSAILNIEGNDYLVKKGDTVNNYKILNITKDNVTVKLGKNTFTAGIGEILTEGEVIKNDVSNLDRKFGGTKR